MTYSLENIYVTNDNGTNSDTYKNIRCLNANSSNHYFITKKKEAYINNDTSSKLSKIYLNNKADYLMNPLNKCNIDNHITKNSSKNELFRIKQSSRKIGYNKELDNKENKSNIYKSINNQNKVSSSLYCSELKAITVGKPEKYIKDMKFVHNEQSDAIIGGDVDIDVEELNAKCGCEDKNIKNPYLSPDNSTKHGSYDRYLSKLKVKVYTKNLINSEVKLDNGNSIIKKTILFNMNCNCRNIKK